MSKASKQSTAVTFSSPIFLVTIVLAIVYGISGHPLYVEYFYSHSFIPDALKIDYEVEHHIGIYYNVTAFRPFPGQLLLNLFVRKYNAIRGQPSMDILKKRNLDFCRTLDRQRNITNDGDDTKPFLLQDTFVTSCPLVNGFYYIKNGTIPNSILPSFIDAGRYIIHFELIQVINELVKLMNLRFILAIKENDYNENESHVGGDYDDEDEDDEEEEEGGEEEEEGGGEGEGKHGEGDGEGEPVEEEQHGEGKEQEGGEEHTEGEEEGKGLKSEEGAEETDGKGNGSEYEEVEKPGDKNENGDEDRQIEQEDSKLEKENEVEEERDEEGSHKTAMKKLGKMHG